MEEASPTYIAAIDAASAILAVGMMAIAALVDLRTMRIPNLLTFPAIALGLLLTAVRCYTGYPVIEFLITAAISWAIVYALWTAGLWGGGDAKATLAVSLLLSPIFPPLSFVAAFMLFMAISLIVRETMSSTLRAALDKDLKPMMIAVSPLLAAAVTFALLSSAGLFISSLSAVVVLAVMADLTSAFTPAYEKALLGESSEMSLAGRRAAEDVYLTGQGPVRARKPAGILASAVFKPVKPEGDTPLIPTRRSGMLPEDIRMLKKHISHIELVPLRPMGPVLFVSMIAALAAQGAGLI